MARSRGAPICPKISKVQIFGSFLLVTVAVGSFLAVAVGAPFAGAGGTKSSRSICHTTLVEESVDRRRSTVFSDGHEGIPNSGCEHAYACGERVSRRCARRRRNPLVSNLSEDRSEIFREDHSPISHHVAATPLPHIARPRQPTRPAERGACAPCERWPTRFAPHRNGQSLSRVGLQYWQPAR